MNPACSRLAFGAGALMTLSIAASASAQRPDGRQRPEAGPLPEGAIARIGRPRLRLPGQVINVAFAPRGTTFVTTGNPVQGSRDTERLVVLWDAVTGKELRQFRGHKAGVEALAFSVDGQRIATGGLDKTARLWDVTTGNPIREFTGHTERVLVVACSPDGKRLASQSRDATIRLWDVETGKELKRLPGQKSNGTSNLRFSPDGSVLASVAADFSIRLWNPDSGAEVKKLAGPAKDSESLDFSPDGKQLTAIDEDGKLWVWELATGKVVVQVQAHNGVGTCVRWSPVGTILATGGIDGLIHFWDRTGRCLRTAEGHPGSNVSEISFSSDGSILASVSHGGKVGLWDVATATALPQAGGQVARIALSQNGKRLATSAGGRLIRFWDPLTGKELLEPLALDHSVGAMQFAREGTLILSGSVDELQVWNVDTRKRLGQMGSRTTLPITQLAVGPSGRLMASSTGGALRLWDAVRRQPLADTTEVLGDAGRFPPFRAMAISNHDHLLLGRGDGRISLVNLARGEEVFTLPAHPPLPGAAALAWSPEGRAFASVGATDDSLRLWEVVTRSERLAPIRLPSRGSSVAVSPDGRLVATGETDGFLRLWDVRTGKELAARAAHSGAVGFVAFMPDSRHLISAGTDMLIPIQRNINAPISGDNTAMVWDVASLVKTMPAIPKAAAADVDALWTVLQGSNAVKAHDAIWQLAAAPELALPMLKERLPKVAPESLSAEALVDRVAKLLLDLDHDEYEVREKATRELIDIGARGLRAVRQANATTKSREVRRRTEEIAAKVLGQTVTRPEEIVLARGVEVLQQLTTREARELLETWAKGPATSPLAEESRAALMMLDRSR